MTILVPYRGVIEIVADHDVGKTIAALQTIYPYKKTVFVDDDVKGDGTVRQMQANDVSFEKYINIGDMRTKLGEVLSPTKLLKEIVYPVIEEISKTKHEVIVWDTWRIVYQSARSHVERNQKDYADIVKWQGNSTMIQGLISKVARMIEQAQLNKLRNACDLLIITHHMKDQYVNNVVVGRIPESSTTFSEVSNMRIWLRRNTVSKVPIMLFLKRPNQPKLVKGQMRFVNIVPMKIIPTAEDNSIWDAIKRYEDKPIESREPTLDERPNAEEMALISGTLSDEQKSYMMEMLKYQKIEEEVINEAVSQNNIPIPVNGVEMFAQAQSKFKYDLSKIKSILGDNYKLKDYKIEDWYVLEKYFEGEKK
jgi:hypothetical protein